MGKIGFGNVSSALIKKEIVEPIGFAAPLQKSLVPEETFQPIESILTKIELPKIESKIEMTIEEPIFASVQTEKDKAKVCPIDPAERAQCDACQ